MKRRLYFLLPDREHALSVISNLERNGLSREGMHIVPGQGIDPEGLPVDVRNGSDDPEARLERRVWLANLVLFFVALVTLLIQVLAGVGWGWVLLPIMVMVVTFVAGLEFATHIPAVHLDAFRDSLHHSELLLMVEVPVSRVSEVDDQVRQRHPEAVVGGVGWAMESLI